MKHQVTLTLQRLAQHEPPRSPGESELRAEQRGTADPTPSAPETDRLSLTPAVIGAGATVVGLAVGVGLSLAAASKRSDRDARVAALGGEHSCGSGTVLERQCTSIRAMDADAQDLATVGVAGFATAGLCAAATLTYLLWPREQRAEQGVGIRPSVSPVGASLAIGGSL